MSFDTLLVANRGEIARRVMRSAREMGIRSVAVYVDADRDAPFVGDADVAVPVAENTAILEARYKKLGGSIQVIHKPGVGHHPHSLKDPASLVKFILNAHVRGEN